MILRKDVYSVHAFSVYEYLEIRIFSFVDGYQYQLKCVNFIFYFGPSIMTFSAIEHPIHS